MEPRPGESTTADKLGHKGGLIAAYRLQGDGSARSLGWEVLDSDPLGSIEDGDLWVHLDRTAPKARGWLESTSRVPKAAIHALLSPDPRPRLTHFTEQGEFVSGFVLILRGVNLNPDSEPEDMVTIRLWIDAHRVITLRRRKVMAIQLLRDQLLKGTGPRDSADFVHRLAGGLIERMHPVIERLDEQMGSEEERADVSDSVTLRIDLSSMRRTAIHLRRYLVPQRDVLDNLAASSPAWFTTHDRMMVHDAADRAARVVDDLEELRARAAAAYEELSVRAAERMNLASTKLTTVATIFLPIGFVASVWGMNVPGLPGAGHPQGFWVLAAVMMLIAGGMWTLARWMLKQ